MAPIQNAGASSSLSTSIGHRLYLVWLPCGGRVRVGRHPFRGNRVPARLAERRQLGPRHRRQQSPPGAACPSAAPLSRAVVPSPRVCPLLPSPCPCRCLPPAPCSRDDAPPRCHAALYAPGCRRPLMHSGIPAREHARGGPGVRFPPLHKLMAGIAACPRFRPGKETPFVNVVRPACLVQHVSPRGGLGPDVGQLHPL